MELITARRLVTVTGVSVATVLACASPINAQERPPAVVELAAGAHVYVDDNFPVEGFVGGAGRVYLSPRMSVGPEISLVQGQLHSHLILTGNLTFDLLRPADGQPRAVTPFVVVGGGIFQTRESFPFGETFTSSDGSFTAGGGVRALVGRNVVVGGEGRIGWETHFRLNGFVGFRLGR